MEKRKPRKAKRKPGLARPTAAERRMQRSESNALRQQINPPQIVREIKANQRRLAKMLKPGYYDIDEGAEIIEALAKNEVSIMDAQNKTNLALLRFVLPTLKSVEIDSQSGPQEITVTFPDLD